MAASVRITFKANRAGINATTRLPGVVHDLDRRADRVIAAAGASVHEVTGEYRRGLVKEHFVRTGTAGVRVTATVRGAIREFGTRPHVIEPKTKQALAWPGGRHPVKRVNHPGTPAFHTLRNVLKAARL
jgi:hypothetical protein